MRDLPHICFRIPAGLNKEGVRASLNTHWDNFARIIVEPFLSADDLATMLDFLGIWVDYVYEYQRGHMTFGSQQYFTSTHFPGFIVNASVYVDVDCSSQSN